jgi:hypothetical protein
MAEPETDTTWLEAHDDKIRDTVEKKAEVAKLGNLMNALDLARNLDEVSDDRRKEVFISQISFEELDRLYKFLWRFTG